MWHAQVHTGAIMPRCTFCRDYRALEESAQLWLAIMKALRLRGESGEPGLRRCATQMLITKQYLAMGKNKGGGWEGVLREALVVSALASRVAHVCVLWLSCLRMFCNFCAVNAEHIMNLQHALCVALCLSIFGAKILCCFWLLTAGNQGTIWLKLTLCAVW